MTKEELKNIIEQNRCTFTTILKHQHVDVYNEINNKYDFKTFSEKVYCFINENLDVGKCEICGNRCTFISMKLGYNKRCSYSCLGKNKEIKSKETRYCVICNNEFVAYKIQEKTTCSYDCLLILNKSDAVVKKRLKTQRESCLRKYGVDSYLKTPEFKDKLRKTKLEKYGDENYVNVEKYKQTCLERYGVDNFTKTKSYKQKSIDTCMKKYGVDNISKTREHKRKCEETSLQKYGVTHFSKTQRRKQKQYNATLSKLTNVSPTFSLDDYKGAIGYRYEFICNTCGNRFSDTLTNGHLPRCKICFPPVLGKSQNEITSFIKSIYTDIVIENSRTIIPPFELDIYLPNSNIAIEYDGLFWHSDYKRGKGRTYHLNKTEECSKKGIHLVHIFEDEWLFKKDIIKQKLKAIIGIFNAKIYARNCIVKEIETSICNVFLEKNHIQGKDKSAIRLGLFYNDLLVSVMTFGKYRYALGHKNIRANEYEMYRFCVGNISVLGAGGKLLNYFIKTYNPNKIITYADRRWSKQSAFYEKIGFKFIKNTPPNYWYLDDYDIRYNRLTFQKHKLKNILKIFDSNLSEWENMKNNGYDRIWDCGNLKYEWNSYEEK